MTAKEPVAIVTGASEGIGRATAVRLARDSSAVQRPIAVQCIQEKAPMPARKTIPTWYLVAEEDRMINPETQRFMAGRMGATFRSYSVDHTPMHTAPDNVVDIILGAAQATHS